MVLPIIGGVALLAGLRTIALKAIPFIRPIATKVVKGISKKFFGSPLRATATITAGSFLAGTPTARKALVKIPTQLPKIAIEKGRQFETAITKEKIKEPKGKVAKALEVGGAAGLVAAGTVLAAKAIKKRKREKEAVIAQLPKPVPAIPAIAALPVTPEGVVGKEPMKAIIAPAAVEEPKPRKRAVKPQAVPSIINQIQISTV